MKEQSITLHDVRALAAQSRKEQRFIPLTKEEVAVRQSALAQLLMEDDDEALRFAEMSREYNVGKKLRKKDRDALLLQIRNREEEREVLVHYVPDFDSGMMSLYTDDGTFLLSRRLTPEERQTNIHQLQSKAA